MIRRAHFLEFTHERRRNLDRRLVGYHANLLASLHSQAHIHRVVSPRCGLWIKRSLTKVLTRTLALGAPFLAFFARSGDFDFLYRNTHYPIFRTATGSSSSPASVSSIM